MGIDKNKLNEKFSHFANDFEKYPEISMTKQKMQLKNHKKQ